MSNETKHAPWEFGQVPSLGEWEGTVHVTDSNGRSIFDALANPEMVEKARLIAAAPDLLAALKLLTTAREGSAGFNAAFRSALAAISKAEGKQS